MSSRLRRSLVLTTLLALLLGVSGAAAQIPGDPTNTKVAGIDVDATTIPELQELMDSRRMNVVQLTNFYLRRIRQLNPTLNAVITVSPTALADARAADAARRRGDDSPLLGIPIIVKDNVNTTGMPTTAGYSPGSTPDDAFIVHQLGAAGALVIGKANLSEWANFRSGPSSSGWSGIGARRTWPTSSIATHAARARARRHRLGRPRGRGRGHRDRRLGRLPLGRQRQRRHQADARPPEPGWHRPDLGRPGHRLADGPQHDRRRSAPGSDDRRRSRRSGDGRAGWSRVHRLHPVPRC